MNKRLLLWTICAFSTVFIFAQDPTLVTINGKEISKSAFEYLYTKNNVNTSLDKKSMEEYFDMFINFKLKVAEAETLKMDTAKNFIDELEGYRRQLAINYLIDNEYKEKLIKETFERMKEDVEVAHIFIKVESNVPFDTLQKYNKAKAIVERLKTEDFTKVAKEVSEDPKSKVDGGYLGYVVAMKMVYPFESAAYNTPIGNVSMPVRSMYGYHVLKVLGRRPSRGKLLVAHILKMTNDTLPEKNITAQNDIQLLYTKIKDGEDFGKLAKENSEDTYSAQSNGELPWIETGNTVKEFEDAAYGIKEKGEISRPVKTPYGWHIIKLLDTKLMGSYEEEKSEIEKSFGYSDRPEMIRNAFYAKLKKMYTYTFDKKALAQLEKVATVSTDSVFYIKVAKFKKPLFTFADKIYTQDQLVSFLKEKKLPCSNLREGLHKFSNAEIYGYENSMLEKKYPDFRNLVQEYRDGILLFNISNNKIWEKAMSDTLGLKQFFQNNKANYTWDTPRFRGRVIYCKNKKVEIQVRDILKNAAADSIDVRLKRLNKDGNMVKSEYGLFAKGSKKEIDYYVFRLGDYKPTADYPIVFVDGKLISNPESCEDVKGKVIQDYQAYLDKEWIKQLRIKYPVNIDQQVLKTIKKD